MKNCGECKWIKIEDKRPPRDSYVLIATSTGLVTSTFYCETKGYYDTSCGPITQKFIDEFGKHSVRFEHAARFGYMVTHWMPLPKPPRKDVK